MKKTFIKQTRRNFLKVTSLAGTSLLVSINLPGCSEEVKTGLMRGKKGKELKPNAWIRIDGNDNITVIVNHTELGQGIATALPMIIAEDLEADWSKVRAEMAPVARVYYNPVMYSQTTAGSTSVPTSWDILRNAGSVTRDLFIRAASEGWDVPFPECHASESRVIHERSGRTLRYGELIEKAASLPLPEKAVLKKPEDFKIIGKRVPRLDTVDKTYGKTVFGTNFKLPGLLVATVVHPPVFNSSMKSLNDKEALASEGVRHVLKIDTGVAVVADTFWQAIKGAEKLQVEWEKSSLEKVSSRDLMDRWSEMSKKKGKVQYEIGDIDNARGKDFKMVEAAYEVPYQAHATAEPMNCTAHVREDRCDIWVPTQAQSATRDIACRITGLSREKVFVHTLYTGGGFGRRTETDFAREAVQLSMKINEPVKVIWTREEDIQHDFYRPATFNLMKALLNEEGLPVTWLHRIVGADHFPQKIPEMLPSMVPDWIPGSIRQFLVYLLKIIIPFFVTGKFAIGGAVPLPYGIENVRAEFISDDPGIPIGFWRSVSNSQNAFLVESFVDEIAAASGRDPYEMRRSLLSGSPRMLNVLELAAEKAGWEKKPGSGIYRGIAVHDFHNTFCCFEVEISINRSGEIRVHRVVSAVDCGIVINPKIVEAQVQGGIAFGLTATIKSSATVREGRVEQSNFDDFPLLKMSEMPEVEVYIVPSSDPPTGIGEVGVPPIAPAVANAVYAATGKRIRKLPILPTDLA